MHPSNRNFVDSISEVFGDHERLEVESIAGEFGSFEDVHRCGMSEHFEPALGVVDATNADELDDFVEHPSGGFSIPRLTNLQFRTGDRPAADGDVGALKHVR